MTPEPGARRTRRYFDHARYEAADVVQLPATSKPLTYVANLGELPIENARFDRILCTQVLEHVPDPQRVLAELHRVLKPGGRILFSAPLFFPEHQKPHDYYRYTRFALRRLFEEAGFSVVTIEWLEGYFGTVSYQFDVMYRDLPRDGRGHGWRRWVLRFLLVATRTFARIARGAFARADLRWTYTKSGHPKNYVVVAEKPLTV